ncbi:MAG: cobalt-precorrin-5B (C(1))-methyltransferase CbiD [Ruminococcus sp.]|nr:cobalt-precorrin-5B (C(1))-methyltransferase CbiD [Ruminococcus sp.]
MSDRYIYRGTKRLRCGYTTGSCAAGAAKAAAKMLLSGITVESIDIVTPSGQDLKLYVIQQNLCANYASCAVVKDGGDDPDVTNGIAIFAEVSKMENDIEILGGEGIGIVTKAGLDQPVGEAAINSVPRKMIASAVNDIANAYNYNGGFRIIISAPMGKEIAKKTFNPRMGIVDGISIIGTTGVVEPMSNSAIIETIRTEANIRKASGYKNILFNLGNYSEDFIKLRAEKLASRAVVCSNFIGDAIDIGASLGFKGILIIGHIGKLIKLGSGIMNTHSSYADGRMETLMACGTLAKTDNDILSQLAECVTVDAALDILYKYNAAEQVLAVLAKRVEYYLRARVKDEAEIGAVIFSNKHELILKTKTADNLIKKISEE